MSEKSWMGMKKKKNVIIIIIIIIFFFFTEKKMIREMSRQGANYFPSLLHSRLKCAGE